MVHCVSQKSFDFLHEETVHEVVSEQRQEAAGEWMTFWQVVKELGGSEQQDAVNQATNCWNFCQQPELKDWAR